MADARIIICKNCREKVSIDNVRYDRDGHDLICVPCYRRGPAPVPQKSLADREKFMCMRCNYKFSIRKDSRLARKCPYCSSSNVTQHETITSTSVLHEVTARPEVAFLR